MSETEIKIPRHLAIILDGNGRWAKRRNLPRLMGHRAGLRNLENMVRVVKDKGIRYFSVYAFSTENWNRPVMEVTGLMRLFGYYLRRKVEEIKSMNVRIRFCGRKDRIPEDLLKQMQWAEDYTKDGKELDFILCLNYGGRAEILDAVNSLIASKPDSPVTEEDLRKHFYLPDVPDPDLIIRTSGELRLSNFWLWESAYSEYYFTSIHWPDFNENELDKALSDYSGRERRYGGLKS
ncbi:MAG: di-trans,poly-cis-decaprenylcistransferase [Synergistaceae bacterium]|nr:di-trans,poly-cis-decaprenylcistransferase [Synergistaceae bacterium]MBQ6969393.1 di-trans,poly-cis-decaprenylcistransferase [Synergistaceae bacterium]